jgi:membrane-bound lytic murein transglycosylase D
VAQLARLNELNPAKPIFPGQKLKLPRNARRPKSPSQPRGSQSKSGSKRPAGAKPAATSSPKRAAETKTKPRSPKARAKPRVHIVQKNQTLLGIARRYRVSLRALLNANGLSADKPIRPGQRLQIPATKR